LRELSRAKRPAGITLCACLWGLVGTLFLASVGGAAEPSLIPWPAKVATEGGDFVVTGQTPICATGVADSVVRQFQATVKAVAGIDLEARRCGGAAIALVLSPTATVADTEGYTLEVNSTGVRVEARADAGLYYGAMTAAQLLSTGTAQAAAVKLQGMHIEDFPRFKWRGLMLDPARHFVSVADVKTLIDQMSQHKLNVLHLHLTDDQGWRLQIK
jgi:hexosaminidase